MVICGCCQRCGVKEEEELYEKSTNFQENIEPAEEVVFKTLSAEIKSVRLVLTGPMKTSLSEEAMALLRASGFAAYGPKKSCNPI